MTLRIPVLSILVPTYNSSRFIDETLNSIFNQKFKDFELLIYDDGSTDNTLQKLRRISDDRTSLYEGKINKGVIYARSFLLSKARGEFISFMDSDDVCHKNKYTTCINHLNKNLKVDLIGSRIDYVDTTSRRLLMMPSFESIEYNDIKADLLFNNTFSTSTVIFRRKLIPEILSIKQEFNMAEDYKIWATLAKNNILVNSKSKLTRYRIHSTSLSHLNSALLKDSLTSVHKPLLVALGFSATGAVLEVHNKFLYDKDIGFYHLLKSVIHYKTILHRNLIMAEYKDLSLKRAINKNWFLKCMYASNHIGFQSVSLYISAFPYHNLKSLKYLIYLMIYYVLKKFKTLLKYSRN